MKAFVSWKSLWLTHKGLHSKSRECNFFLPVSVKIEHSAALVVRNKARAATSLCLVFDLPNAKVAVLAAQGGILEVVAWGTLSVRATR